MFLKVGIFLVVFHQEIKPTILIGTSGKGRQFTQEVVEAMASLNEVILLYFSNNYNNLSLFAPWGFYQLN